MKNRIILGFLDIPYYCTLNHNKEVAFNLNQHPLGSKDIKKRGKVHWQNKRPFNLSKDYIS